jgi:hypothetical protein
LRAGRGDGPTRVGWILLMKWHEAVASRRDATCLDGDADPGCGRGCARRAHGQRGARASGPDASRDRGGDAALSAGVCDRARRAGAGLCSRMSSRLRRSDPDLALDPAPSPAALARTEYVRSGAVPAGSAAGASLCVSPLRGWTPRLHRPTFPLTEALLVVARLVGAFRIELASRQPVLSVAVVTTQPDHAPLYHLSVAEQGCAEGPPVMHPVVLEAAQAVFGAATTNLLRRSCLGRVGQSLGTEAVGERSGLTWRADALVRVTGAENDSDKLVFLRTIRSICSRFVLERDTALRYQLLPLAWTVPSPLERCTTHSRDVNHAAIQLRGVRPNSPNPTDRG